MPRRLTAASRNERPSHTDVPLSLDEQLSSVVEQEGVLLMSPRGSRKRRRSNAASIFSVPELVSSTPITEDAIADFDHQALGLVVRPEGISRERSVQVQYKDHAKSAYVLSLQGIRMFTSGPTADERVPVKDAVRAAVLTDGERPPEIYATVSSDLAGDSFDPHLTADQFTPETFEAAYAAVYGSFDGLRSVLRDAWSVMGSLFQRVESVEQHIVEETETALTVLEVPRVSFARAMVGFVALALIVTLPANAVSLYRAVSTQGGAATDAGNAAVGDLTLAKDAGSITSSAEALKQASSRFREADALLSDASALAVGLASVLPKEYRSARALLEIGDKSSEAARLLALGLDKVFAEPSRRLDERLDVLGAYARTSLVLLSDAAKAAATVDTASIPADKRAQVTKLLSELDSSTQAVREFAALSDLLSVMVGKENQRNYLVIFQNNTELRPTGGFMGSFAEVRMDKGALISVSVPPGGTYALKGQLLERIAPPKPMQLIAPLWQFQDANWSPDFPTAANKIRWFWSRAGQPTIDGVVSVNATFVEKVLALTGPIEMSEYGKTITADNFLLETQKAVEVEYDKQANTPKKFIGDLGTKLMARLSSMPREDWLKIAGLVSSSLESKDIQLALMDPSEEQIAERYGWNGRMKPSSGDELAIVEANIAGQKTDGMVKEKVDQQVTVADDGSMQTSLTLTRTHTGTKGEMFSGVRNVSYVRFYVPKGSKLLSASGFQTPDAKLFKTIDSDVATDTEQGAIEATDVAGPGDMTISDEGDRTVFGGWLQLDPGQTQIIALTYQLPMTTNDILSRAEAAPQQTGDAKSGAYLLLLTSQSGKSDRELHTTVILPKDWAVSWNRTADATGNGLGYSGTWDHDIVLAAILTPPHGQTTIQTTPSTGD